MPACHSISLVLQGSFAVIEASALEGGEGAWVVLAWLEEDKVGVMSLPFQLFGKEQWSSFGSLQRCMCFAYPTFLALPRTKLCFEHPPSSAVEPTTGCSPGLRDTNDINISTE